MPADPGMPRRAAPTTDHSEDLMFAGLVRQAAMLGDGSVCSRELVDTALARIDATQGTLNAFRVVRHEAAREEAAEADRRLAAGERLPLLGVPIAIKDDMDLAGETTPFGCEGGFTVRETDGEVARRLRAAGAVIVGKTNTPELGQWPVTSGPAFGVTRNPWNLDHTPGGSSGGSAAAVAAGLVASAIGSDGAGSVRIPASWTNLVGIKPQRGRVSGWPDADPFNGLTTIGPLARSVGDAALLLDALTGNHPGDRHKLNPPVEPFTAAVERTPKRLRVALSFRIPFSGAPAALDPEIRAMIERFADVLRDLGHEVFEADPPYRLIGSAFMPMSTTALREWAARVPDQTLLDPRTLQNVKMGRALGPLLRPALAGQGWLRRRVGSIFNKADVLLTPTTALAPPPAAGIDGLSSWQTDKTIVGACPYAWPWNVLGWPGISVPAGRTRAGLPIGAQLLGPASSEARLIGLAAQVEARERWHERRPPFTASDVTAPQLAGAA